MNSAKNLCFLFLLSLTLALAACGGGGGNSNSGDGYNPPDMLAGDLNDDASAHNDSNVKPDNCTSPYGCANIPDAGTSDTKSDVVTPCTDNTQCDEDNERCDLYQNICVTPQCVNDEWCGADEWCDTTQYICWANSNPEFQPFMFFHADWKCVGGGCSHVGTGKIYSLHHVSWNAETQIAKFYGLTTCVNWHIWQEGSILKGEGTSSSEGNQCTITKIEGNFITFSVIVDGVPEDDWTWERQ